MRHRTEAGEILKPIPAAAVEDVRRGYIFVGGTAIPFHRVEEIRRVDGQVVFRKRGSQRPAGTSG